MTVYARMDSEALTAYRERRFGIAPILFLCIELKKMAREGLVSAKVGKIDGKVRKVVDVDLDILRIAVQRCEAGSPFIGNRIHLEMDREAKHFVNREVRIPYFKLLKAASRLIKSGLISINGATDEFIQTVGDKLVVKTDLLMARRLVAVATDGRK